MRIATGQLAPTFSATTFKGEAVTVEQFRGKKLWIAFHRWASCPLCNMRIREVIERYDEIEAQGIQLVAVFQSPPETIAKYVGAQDPPFPLISDPDMKLYAQYGVDVSWSGLFYPRVIVRAIQATLAGLLSVKIDGPIARIPADFLLDPEGLVWKAYYGDAVSDHIPFEDVDAFAADRCLELPDASAIF